MRAACLPLWMLAVLFLALPASSGERTILRVYAWSGFFAGDVLAEFEDANDCIVAIDTFDSNEAMLESLDGADRPYDLITPSSYMALEMRRRGLLRDIDRTRIPNADRLDSDFLAATEDPEMRYSVLYTRTVTGVGYNADSLGMWKKAGPFSPGTTLPGG